MSIHLRRVSILAMLAGAMLPFAARAQGAQDYPNRPIHIVVSTPVGDGTEFSARLMGLALTAAWKQPVVVEPMPGANGMLAAGAVARAAADGYTVLLSHGAIVQNEALQPSKPYKMEQLVPVAMIQEGQIGFAVNSSIPARTLDEFVKLVRADPTKYSYASYGVASAGHVLGEILKQSAKIEMPHIAYKGASPAVADLAAGHVSAAFAGMGTLGRQAEGGKIRILAVSGTRRATNFANVPTFAESGYPEASLTGISGYYLPAGTPKAIVAKLSAELVRIANTPEVSAKFVEWGFMPSIHDSAAFDTIIKTDVARWKKAATAANIKLD